jgi:CspA family cold shock protein
MMEAATDSTRIESNRRCNDTMATGKIKKLTDRGFGFITLDEGGEAFFHRSGLAAGAESFYELSEGDTVECDIDATAPKGPRAVNVRVMASSPTDEVA